MHGAAEVLPQRHDIKSANRMKTQANPQPLSCKHANDSPFAKGAMAQYAMIRAAVHLKHVRNAPSLNCKYTLQQ